MRPMPPSPSTESTSYRASTRVPMSASTNGSTGAASSRVPSNGQNPASREKRWVHAGQRFIAWSGCGGAAGGRPAGGAELARGRHLDATTGAELLLRDQGRPALGAELPARLLGAALAAGHLGAARRERGRGRRRLHAGGHVAADAQADRHLRAEARDAAAHPV